LLALLLLLLLLLPPHLATTMWGWSVLMSQSNAMRRQTTLQAVARIGARRVGVCVVGYCPSPSLSLCEWEGRSFFVC
jgi:hypothetical protein